MFVINALFRSPKAEDTHPSANRTGISVTDDSGPVATQDEEDGSSASEEEEDEERDEAEEEESVRHDESDHDARSIDEHTVGSLVSESKCCSYLLLVFCDSHLCYRISRN